MRALDTYEDWRHCITVLCGIPLTLPYIEQRLAVLCDPKDYTTQKFVGTWGEPHLARVCAWFARARDDLRQAGSTSPDPNSTQ